MILAIPSALRQISTVTPVATFVYGLAVPPSCAVDNVAHVNISVAAVGIPPGTLAAGHESGNNQFGVVVHEWLCKPENMK